MCTRNVLVSVLVYLSYMTYTRRVQVPHPGEGRVINYREGVGGTKWERVGQVKIDLPLPKDEGGRKGFSHAERRGGGAKCFEEVF